MSWRQTIARRAFETGLYGGFFLGVAWNPAVGFLLIFAGLLVAVLVDWR